MVGVLDGMKLKEYLPDAGEREVEKIEYRQLDKHGRLYISPDLAKKEFVIILLEPVPGDKEKFVKVGRS